MIDIKKCYGCGACSIICPCDAICMKINEDGFYRPFIDKAKCINCGKCDKVCPRYSKNKQNIIGKYGLFAAHSKNRAVLKSSSSGGVCYEIAFNALAQNMYVIGTKYNYEKDIAESIVCDKVETLLLCSGTKYIQSNISNAVKNIIKIKKKAVIIGLPCQISGINEILVTLHIRDNFLLIDLVCKSIPSYHLWWKFLEPYKKQNEINCVDFRDKNYGWKSGNVSINGVCCGNDYKNVFTSNIACQKECSECRFCIHSDADIRTGDFWGRRFLHKNTLGESMVICNTKKGLDYFSSIRNLSIKKAKICEYLSQKVTNFPVNSNYEVIMKLLKNPNSTFYELKSFIPKYKITVKHVLSSYLPLFITLLLKKNEWNRVIKDDEKRF